jgi:hypothetical protein
MKSFKPFFYKAQTNANDSKIAGQRENILKNCVLESYRE